jgi:hypothetical protein
VLKINKKFSENIEMALSDRGLRKVGTVTALIITSA